MAKEYSIEKSLEELEKINTQLKNGDLSLDDAIKLYEQGTKLVAQSYNKLNNAELKIKKISEESFGQKPQTEDSKK